MRNRLLALAFFGVAFAFVEAAVVFYLRKIIGVQTAYPQTDYRQVLNLGMIAFITTTKPILESWDIQRTEMIREFCTLVMLAAIAYLSAPRVKQRWGAFLIAFSLWDLSYYLFLKFLTGWPTGLFDIDIYFLLPIAWIGPVITALIVSTILLLLGLKLFTEPIV